MYWAEVLAEQAEDAELVKQFKAVAAAFIQAEVTILEELKAAQGSPVGIGGSYQPNEAKASTAMRSSATLNKVLVLIG